MRVRLIVAIAVSILFLTIVTAVVYKKRPVATKEGFAAEEGKPVLTWFMADWCGHCKNMKSEWEKFATMVGDKVALKVVKDGEPGSREAFAEAGVDGFPTIQLKLSDAVDPLVYQGPRTADGLLDFVKTKTA